MGVDGGVVTYSRNGVLLYTSSQPPVYPLVMDTSLYSSGATLNNAMISAP